MTLQQAYQLILTTVFDYYSNEEAKTIANIAIEHVTGFGKLDRLLNKEIKLSLVQEEKLNSVLLDLAKQKPIQQITQEAWFYKQCFFVNEHVLIPRPETEELVNWIIQEQAKQNIHIVDIGTGSGCIAITLKLAITQADITAIDLSEEAIKVAEQNAKILDAEINFLTFNFLEEEHWLSLNEVDVIVSNPPYIKQTEMLQMENNVLHYEPHTALFVPDNNALIFYEKIALFATKKLKSDGAIYVEINEALGKETEQVFKHAGFSTLLKQDLQGKDRIIKAFKK